MKKYKSLLDIVIVIILISLSAAQIAPKTIVMPSSFEMLLCVTVFGLVSAFAVLVWREQPGDEREAENQHFASRSAYLAGCGVLITAMVIQELHHQLDSAIPITLLVMIITKMVLQRFKDKM